MGNRNLSYISLIGIVRIFSMATTHMILYIQYSIGERKEKRGYCCGLLSNLREDAYSTVLKQVSLHRDLTLSPSLCTLQRHNTENSKQIFTGKELRGYSPNSYIPVSVSDLNIPLIGLLILLQEKRWAESGEYIDRSQTHELGLRPRNSFSGNT
jgi:hypothetical protein